MSGRIFFRGFNEIRAIAALLVVFHHIELYKSRTGIASLYDSAWFSGFIAHAGKNGVYLFFALSGFLITYLLLAEKQASGTIRIRQFYTRRILRIWPLYYIIVLIAFGVFYGLYYYTSFFNHEVYAHSLFGKLHAHYLPVLILYVLFVPNVALACGFTVPGASQTWSVGVEEQFYIIWPLIVKLFKRFLLIAFIGIIALKLFLTLYHTRIFARLGLTEFLGLTNVQWGNFLVTFKLEYMALGAIFAWLAYYKKHWLQKIPGNACIHWLLVLLLVALLFFPQAPDLFVLACTLFITYIAIYPQQAKEQAALGKLGKISYGIYMYHPAVMYACYALINRAGITNLAVYNIVIYLTVVPLTLLISHLSYTYVEKKFLKIKSKYAVIQSGSN